MFFHEKLQAEASFVAFFLDWHSVYDSLLETGQLSPENFVYAEGPVSFPSHCTGSRPHLRPSVEIKAPGEVLLVKQACKW